LWGIAPTGETLLFLQGEDNLRRVAIFGLPAALIVYGTMQIKAGQSVWTYLGGASYTLYLTHTFAVTPLQVLWMALPIDANLIVLIGVLASVVLAWRVHELVERPIGSALKQTRIRLG
jgi:exopolysaccharide production protein ExoZ